tara:strand:- start:81 stop:200 length:120 start_codon:yes stop_codon:yes gene_type:complete
MDARIDPDRRPATVSHRAGLRYAGGHGRGALLYLEAYPR